MANTQNLASGTLAEDITASATMVLAHVGDGSATTIKAVWPTAPFFITVMPHNPVAGVSNSMDSEIMKVTAVGNDQVGNVALTVQRAQRGTTAKSFTAGAIVTNGIYAEDVVPPYSTTETATLEKWIDGKTIYKKTIDFGVLPNATTKTIAHNISNLSEVVRVYGIAKSVSGSYTSLPFVPSSAGSLCDLLVNSTNISMSTQDNRSNWSGYVTVYYTKTS